MPEFRQNITTGEWIIIATERAKRPESFKKELSDKEEQIPNHDPSCPFCKGSEHKCKPPVYEVEKQNNWIVRVVPNIFGALNPEESPNRSKQGMFIKAGGYGIAEVVIETPLHNISIESLSIEEIIEVISAYKHRYNHLAKDPNINIINIFRNHGKKAGASLVHPHSRISACLVSPPNVNDQIHYARRGYNTWGNCVYCDLITEELKQQERIVVDSKHFLAFCPYASRSPFEVRILPKLHSSVFGNILEEEIADLAYVLKTVLTKIKILLNDPDYNYLIRSMTTKDGEVPYYHWYLVIIPKITKVAGFEMGTGIYINIASPEQCAQSLREVNVDNLAG